MPFNRQVWVFRSFTLQCKIMRSIDTQNLQIYSHLFLISPEWKNNNWYNLLSPYVMILRDFTVQSCIRHMQCLPVLEVCHLLDLQVYHNLVGLRFWGVPIICHLIYYLLFHYLPSLSVSCDWWYSYAYSLLIHIVYLSMTSIIFLVLP